MKDMLQNGDVLVCKNGTYIYIKNENKDYHLKRQNLLNIDGGFMPLEEYDEDLNFGHDPKDEFSFNKVYRFKYLIKLILFIEGEVSISEAELIWERKEVREMTVAEISKALGYEVKIVKEND